MRLILAALLLAAPIFAHAQPVFDHATGHDMYQNWKRPDYPAGSCCHGKDCGPWPETDVQPTLKGFHINSLGLDVPMSKVLPSPDGQYHLCCDRPRADMPCERDFRGNITLYCFAAPMGM